MSETNNITDSILYYGTTLDDLGVTTSISEIIGNTSHSAYSVDQNHEYLTVDYPPNWMLGGEYGAGRACHGGEPRHR